VLDEQHRQLRDALIRQVQEATTLRAYNTALTEEVTRQAKRIKALEEAGTAAQEQQVRLLAENKKLRDILATIRSALQVAES
jgi:predicted nuclease with TOPRIM domain